MLAETELLIINKTHPTHITVRIILGIGMIIYFKPTKVLMPIM